MRGEARREEEEAAAAASQHAVLRSVFERSVAEGASELEAALAAVGPPGSPPLLAALAHDRHGLLRAWGRQVIDGLDFDGLEALAPLLRACGESPDACAAALDALDDGFGTARTLVSAPLKHWRWHARAGISRLRRRCWARAGGRVGRSRRWRRAATGRSVPQRWPLGQRCSA
jgi:hypothetical protein